MKLVIDTRERELIKYFDVEVRMLELGDILIEDDNQNVVCIFERKTIEDLYASVKDGRYQNQKKRLVETYDVKKIGYIIEGRGSFEELCDPQSKICTGCCYNMMFRDHLKVIRTRDIKDTADFIKGLFARYVADPMKYIGQAETGIGGSEQIVKLGVVKSPKDFFIRSLCQLPGVSQKTATLIQHKYGTILGLVSAMSDKTPEEKIKLLKEIGGTRKISIRAVQSIIDYLLV